MLFRGRGGRRPRRRGWWARAWSGVRALDVADLGETPLVAVALEGGGQPQREDLAGQAGGDDAAAHRQHVRVVVLAAEAGRVEVVAERSSHAQTLVGDRKDVVEGTGRSVSVGSGGRRRLNKKQKK